MPHTLGGSTFPLAWLISSRPYLMDSVPVLLELLPLQPAGLFRRRSDDLVLHPGLQMLSWMFPWASCGLAAPGVLAGSG
jgi:hypothetical protein